MRELDIWDPFRHLRRTEERMRRLFEGFPAGFDETGLREPLVDILDNGKALQLVAELPGIEKKDIEVSIDGQSLSIRAKSGFEAKEKKKGKGYYYHERGYQSFYRAIPLPVEVAAEKASAEFKNGILKVTIPKKHQEKAPKGHKIEIK